MRLQVGRSTTTTSPAPDSFGRMRSDQVMQKAQVVAHDALDQVQKVAEQAQQTASAPPG